MFNKIKILPNDLISMIYNFIPEPVLIFTNKNNFIKHYPNYLKYIFNKSCIKSIKLKNINIHHYIKNLLQNDKSFILDNLLNIYFGKFISMKKYNYDSMRFATYYHCLQYLSKFVYKAKKCDIVMHDKLVLNGMNKNKYKKVKIINNIWTN